MTAIFRSSENARGSARLAPALLLCALAIASFDALTWYRRVSQVKVVWLSEYFFARQDMWVLGAYAVALLGLALWAWRARETSPAAFGRVAPATSWLLLVAAVGVLLIARLGRDYVFHGYSPSRDELMVELASAYFAQGRIGWPIPAEWQPFHRAMMPEFFSPFGASSHWTAIYLPVHAAITGLFRYLGDGALAAPAMLGIGLLALWRISARLFGDRMDARIVTMVMALSSAQIIVTAMTHYAMTSHFAFNLIWFSLILIDRLWSHVLAGVVALVAAGLHQFHFPLLFIGPFILWMLLRRQWAAALFHLFIIVLIVIVWTKFWPMLLAASLGPPPPSDAHRTAGIVARVARLFQRMDGWQPLVNTSRFIAWNNLLLLPLAMLAPFAVRWVPLTRHLFRDPPIVLPLLLGVAGGFIFSIYQGYGWGFRYMHGQIGPLCLLAGFGWIALRGRQARLAKAVLIVGTAISLLAGLWLARDTERYVRGFARSMEAIRASDTDVVLVDIRGGFYLSDFVRFDEGIVSRPVVMGVHMLSDRQLDQLCARHSVAIVDKSYFWPLGVHPVRLRFGEGPVIDARLAHLKAIGCGGPLVLSPKARP